MKKRLFWTGIIIYILILAMLYQGIVWAYPNTYRGEISLQVNSAFDEDPRNNDWFRDRGDDNLHSFYLLCLLPSIRNLDPNIVIIASVIFMAILFFGKHLAKLIKIEILPRFIIILTALAVLFSPEYSMAKLFNEPEIFYEVSSGMDNPEDVNSRNLSFEELEEEIRNNAVVIHRTLSGLGINIQEDTLAYIFASLLWNESRFRQFDSSGNIITSGKNAKGIAQVSVGEEGVLKEMAYLLRDAIRNVAANPITVDGIRGADISREEAYESYGRTAVVKAGDYGLNIIKLINEVLFNGRLSSDITGWENRVKGWIAAKRAMDNGEGNLWLAGRLEQLEVEIYQRMEEEFDIEGSAVDNLKVGYAYFALLIYRIAYIRDEDGKILLERYPEFPYLEAAILAYNTGYSAVEGRIKGMLRGEIGIEDLFMDGDLILPMERHTRPIMDFYNGLKDGYWKAPGPTWSDEDMYKFKQQLKKVITGTTTVIVEEDLQGAIELIRDKTSEEMDIDKNKIEINTIDIGDNLGIPRFESAENPQELVFACGVPEGGTLRIFVTKAFWDRFLSKNPLMLAELIDHEWHENMLNKSHAEVCSRMWLFANDSGLDPFSRFYLDLLAEKKEYEKLHNLAITPHSNDHDGKFQNYAKDKLAINAEGLHKPLNEDSIHIEISGLNTNPQEQQIKESFSPLKNIGPALSQEQMDRLKANESKWRKKAAQYELNEYSMEINKLGGQPGEKETIIISAKVFYAGGLPPGINAWQFREDENDEDSTRIIVTRSSPAEISYLNELIYHEYREDYWMNGGVRRRRNAHILASAGQVLAFREEGKLTPYHEHQLVNMSIEELTKIIDEYNSGERENYHRKLFKNFFTEEEAALILRYEGLLRNRAVMIRNIKRTAGRFSLSDKARGLLSEALADAQRGLRAEVGRIEGKEIGGNALRPVLENWFNIKLLAEALGISSWGLATRINSGDIKSLVRINGFIMLHPVKAMIEYTDFEGNKSRLFTKRMLRSKLSRALGGYSLAGLQELWDEVRRIEGAEEAEDPNPEDTEAIKARLIEILSGWHTIPQVASEIGVYRSTVQTRIDAGDIRSVVAVGRYLLLPSLKAIAEYEDYLRDKAELTSKRKLAVKISNALDLYSDAEMRELSEAIERIEGAEVSDSFDTEDAHVHKERIIEILLSWYTIPQAAVELGLNQATLYLRIGAKDIQSFVVVGQYTLLHPQKAIAEYKDYLENRAAVASERALTTRLRRALDSYSEEELQGLCKTIAEIEGVRMKEYFGAESAAAVRARLIEILLSWHTTIQIADILGVGVALISLRIRAGDIKSFVAVDNIAFLHPQKAVAEYRSYKERREELRKKRIFETGLAKGLDSCTLRELQRLWSEIIRISGDEAGEKIDIENEELLRTGLKQILLNWYTIPRAAAMLDLSAQGLKNMLRAGKIQSGVTIGLCYYLHPGRTLLEYRAYELGRQEISRQKKFENRLLKLLNACSLAELQGLWGDIRRVEGMETGDSDMEDKDMLKERIKGTLSEWSTIHKLAGELGIDHKRLARRIKAGVIRSYVKVGGCQYLHQVKAAEEYSVYAESNPMSKPQMEGRQGEEDDNRSCGTVCEPGHEGSYVALDEQLKRQFEVLREILGITEDRDLTEEEADKALAEYAKRFGIEVACEQLQEYRNQIKAADEVLKRINIFFSIPGTGTGLFWVGEDYAGGHFNGEGTRIHISLPVLLRKEIEFEGKKITGLDVAKAIARHELTHIFDEEHSHDEGVRIVRQIARKDKGAFLLEQARRDKGEVNWKWQKTACRVGMSKEDLISAIIQYVAEECEGDRGKMARILDMKPSSLNLFLSANKLINMVNAIQESYRLLDRARLDLKSIRKAHERIKTLSIEDAEDLIRWNVRRDFRDIEDYGKKLIGISKQYGGIDFSKRIGLMEEILQEAKRTKDLAEQELQEMKDALAERDGAAKQLRLRQSEIAMENAKAKRQEAYDLKKEAQETFNRGNPGHNVNTCESLIDILEINLLRIESVLSEIESDAEKYPELGKYSEEVKTFRDEVEDILNEAEDIKQARGKVRESRLMAEELRDKALDEAANGGRIKDLEVCEEIIAIVKVNIKEITELRAGILIEDEYPGLMSDIKDIDSCCERLEQELERLMGIKSGLSEEKDPLEELLKQALMFYNQAVELLRQAGKTGELKALEGFMHGIQEKISGLVIVLNEIAKVGRELKVEEKDAIETVENYIEELHSELCKLAVRILAEKTVVLEKEEIGGLVSDGLLKVRTGALLLEQLLNSIIGIDALKQVEEIRGRINEIIEETENEFKEEDAIARIQDELPWAEERRIRKHIRSLKTLWDRQQSGREDLKGYVDDDEALEKIRAILSSERAEPKPARRRPEAEKREKPAERRPKAGVVPTAPRAAGKIQTAHGVFFVGSEVCVKGTPYGVGRITEITGEKVFIEYPEPIGKKVFVLRLAKDKIRTTGGTSSDDQKKSYTGSGGGYREAHPSIEAAFEDGTAVDISDEPVTKAAKFILLGDDRFRDKDKEFVDSATDKRGFSDLMVITVPMLSLSGHYGKGGSVNEHMIPTVYVPKKLYEYILERYSRGDSAAVEEFADYLYHKYAEMRLRLYFVFSEKAHRILSHKGYENEEKFLLPATYEILRKARERLMGWINIVELDELEVLIDSALEKRYWEFTDEADNLFRIDIIACCWEHFKEVFPHCDKGLLAECLAPFAEQGLTCKSLELNHIFALSLGPFVSQLNLKPELIEEIINICISELIHNRREFKDEYKAILVDIGKRYWDVVFAIMREKYRARREWEAGIKILGEIGNPDAVGFFLEILGGSTGGLHDEIIRALGNFPQSSKQIVPVLLKILYERDNTIRVEPVIDALSRLGDESALPYVVRKDKKQKWAENVLSRFDETRIEFIREIFSILDEMNDLKRTIRPLADLREVEAIEKQIMAVIRNLQKKIKEGEAYFINMLECVIKEFPDLNDEVIYVAVRMNLPDVEKEAVQLLITSEDLFVKQTAAVMLSQWSDFQFSKNREMAEMAHGVLAVLSGQERTDIFHKYGIWIIDIGVEEKLRFSPDEIKTIDETLSSVSQRHLGARPARGILRRPPEELRRRQYEELGWIGWYRPPPAGEYVWMNRVVTVYKTDELEGTVAHEIGHGVYYFYTHWILRWTFRILHELSVAKLPPVGSSARSEEKAYTDFAYPYGSRNVHEDFATIYEKMLARGTEFMEKAAKSGLLKIKAIIAGVGAGKGRSDTISPNPAIATPGMYNEEQHEKMNKKIRRDLENGVQGINGSGVQELREGVWAGLDEETRQALEEVTLFLLPPEDPEYPYYLRTEIPLILPSPHGGEGSWLEYQVAHAGTNQGQGRFVYMTRQAFMELPVAVVVRILKREARLAGERYGGMKRYRRI